MRVHECVVAVAVVLGCAIGAFADERKGALYLFGGMTMPYQRGATGESTGLYIEAPGGATLGWSVGGGVRVAKIVSVEAEWSTTGWMRAQEVSRTGLTQTGTYIEERRDRFALFVGRFHIGRPRSIAVEPVAGIAVTNPEGWSELEGDLRGRQRVPLKAGAAPAFGLDLSIRRGRLALVPSLRLIIASTGSTSGYPAGYPQVTWRPTLGVRLNVGPE